MTLWPQSFLRTSLLYCCLTQSIAIQILININLLISIKIRLPLDQFSLASVWHCRPLITQTTPPPHHTHTHTQTQQPLTLASIRLTVFVRVSTVIKKCPWCNFMPVDTRGPYAKDYGMPACRISARHCGAGGPGPSATLWEPLMALVAGVRATMAEYSRVSTGGLPSTSAAEQPGNPPPPPLPCATLTYHIKASAVSQHMSSLCVWGFNVGRLSFTFSEVATNAQWNRGQWAGGECSGEALYLMPVWFLSSAVSLRMETVRYFDCKWSFLLPQTICERLGSLSTATVPQAW